MDTIEAIKQKYATGDYFPRSLGIELVDLTPGCAKVEMVIRDDMLNFHGIGHGGAIFTLADTALGLASNSRGVPAVAITVNIDFLAMAKPGRRLTAVAEEDNLTRRTGVYRVGIVDDQGEKIAQARGIVYRKTP